jgi:hygromycin-B 4-O-kinase
VTTIRGISAAEVRQGVEIARSIIHRHVGGAPQLVVHQTGGLRNLVYAVTHGEGDFIVRLSLDRARLDAYRKEQFVTTRARAAGVPTPEVLYVGDEAGSFSFMVQRRAHGRQATQHPKRWRIVRDMGRYAAIINSVATTGFGTALHRERPGQTGATWREFLEHELKLDARIEALAHHRMLSLTLLHRLRSTLEGAADPSDTPRLNHGDLRLKNVLVDERGSITAIIDWEDCMSSLAPHWEWSVALHDLSIDEKQDFLQGYGASKKRILELAPVIKALNIVNYVPEIERLAANKRLALLQRIRTRFSGALDLYSL